MYNLARNCTDKRVVRIGCKGIGAARPSDPFYILGAFAKFRKATSNFVMPVRISVRIEQLDSHWTDFHEILFGYFSKICLENSNFINI